MVDDPQPGSREKCLPETTCAILGRRGGKAVRHHSPVPRPQSSSLQPPVSQDSDAETKRTTTSTTRGHHFGPFHAVLLAHQWSSLRCPSSQVGLSHQIASSVRGSLSYRNGIHLDMQPSTHGTNCTRRCDVTNETSSDLFMPLCVTRGCVETGISVCQSLVGERPSSGSTSRSGQ